MVDVKDAGDHMEAGCGTAVVMLPGAEGAKEFWRYQLEALAGDYHVVSCRLAVREPSLSSTMADYAADALRIMDSLGIEKAVIVGESMGGMVTQEIAINHPERVLGVVLCNTMDKPRRGGFGFNMFTLATLAHQLAFLPFLTDDARRRLLGWVGRHRGFVMDPTPGNARLIDYLFECGMECGGKSYLDKFLAGRTADYTSRLSSISVPTLVIRGTEDRLVGAEPAVEFVGRIPGASLALIEGGGHCCSYTMPEETTAVLKEWLDSTGLA